MSKKKQTEAPPKQQGENPPLRILYLENDLNDFNLVVRWFKTENVAAVFKRVETREEFLENLTGYAPDVIMLDYHLPQFDALEALQVLQDRQSDIATVLFTGVVGEEQAIECLRLGADDYVTKQNPRRLIPAILAAIEKKKTQESSRKKTEELDRYFNSSLDLLCIADTGGRFLRLNPEWEKTLGYPLQELIGKKFFDLVHPDDLSATLEAVSTLASQKEVLNFENRYRCKDGSYKWIEWRSYPEGDKIFAVARDITERKLVKQELQIREERLKLFVEHAPAAIAMFDKDMRYLALSRRFLQDYRLEQTTIIGRSHYEIFPEIQQKWKDIHRRCLEGAVEQAEKDPFPRMDGSLDWVRWEIHPWYEASGEIGGIILFSEVITDRVRIQEAIEQSERRYRELIETMNDGLGVLDCGGNITFMNRRGCEMLGYQPEELIENPVSMVFDEENHIRFQEQLMMCIKGGRTSHEITWRCKDGRPVDTIVSTNPRYDTHGNLLESVVVFTDITGGRKKRSWISYMNLNNGIR